MDKKRIFEKVDHTLLAQGATWNEIKQICDDGIAFKTASVCIPPSYVKKAAGYVNGRIRVCTVIGFPNGYNTTKIKALEAENAVEEGADEIDMVINIGWVKDGRYDDVLQEIREVKKACHGKLLKVIIETCLLTEEEKRRLCHVVAESGADFIKTSTGFAGGGATFADIKLFAEETQHKIRIKAAGGISSFEDAERFVELGADRLGTSRLVKIAKTEDGH